MAYGLGQATGSAAGQVAGSLVPIPGASLAGGTLGGYLGSLFDQPRANQPMSPQQGGNWLTGYEGQQKQLPRFTPEQQNALNILLQRGLAGSDFGPIEQRARSQFSQQTVPSLAERFTALSGKSRIASPAFASQLGAAGAGLEEGLASLRSQYGMQQLGLGLTPSFENIYIPGQGGIGAPLAQGIGQAGTLLFPLFLQWLQSRGGNV